MPQPIVCIDAFTSVPFAGNPAAVCLLAAAAEEDWMQRVAAEMNLSETAFLRRRDDGGYELRWFTPVCEVELCGHATLASAHLLWEEGHLAGDEPCHDGECRDPCSVSPGRVRRRRWRSWRRSRPLGTTSPPV